MQITYIDLLAIADFVSVSEQLGLVSEWILVVDDLFRNEEWDIPGNHVEAGEMTNVDGLLHINGVDQIDGLAGSSNMDIWTCVYSSRACILCNG